MDLLTDVLRLLEPAGSLSSRLEAGGEWGLRFAGYRHLKIGVVVAGECWVRDLDDTPPQHLSEGDAYVLSSGRPYGLASSPSGPVGDGDAQFRRSAPSRTVRLGSPTTTVLEGGTIVFAARDADLLTEVLPPFLRVAAGGAGGGLRPTIELLTRELQAPAAGSELIVERLTHVLLAQVLRAEPPGLRAGWLAALADPQVRAALELIHGAPERHLAVSELAAAVGLSRSAFAARFAAAVGTSPADYATRWRMRLAARALREPGATVGRVAQEFGYASHSSFSTAFARVQGRPPSGERRPLPRPFRVYWGPPHTTAR